MTLTLTLNPDRENLLREQARQAGLTLDEYAVRVLEQAALSDQPAAQTESEPPAQTLADMLAEHIGTVASGRGDLSQKTGAKFSQLMEEKRRAGRL